MSVTTGLLKSNLSKSELHYCVSLYILFTTHIFSVLTQFPYKLEYGCQLCRTRSKIPYSWLMNCNCQFKYGHQPLCTGMCEIMFLYDKVHVINSVIPFMHENNCWQKSYNLAYKKVTTHPSQENWTYPTYEP